jgi:hypothetical protein
VIRGLQDLDARTLFGGSDVIVFNYSWDQYTKVIVSGVIVFSYTDNTSGLTERVTVANGSTPVGRDKLIFADGSVGTQQAAFALDTGGQTGQYGPDATSVQVGLNTSEQSTSYAPTAPAGNTLRAFASTTSTTTGATFAMAEAAQTLVVTGTGQVDKVYVKAGATVDARNLFGGEDQIFFTGNWADYTKILNPTLGAIHFTRSINGLTETVTVANGVQNTNRDKLVFADGAVLTQNARAALANQNVALIDVDGYDVATKTPFLLPSVHISGRARQGDVLTAGEITGANGGVTGVTYQWQADGADILGANGSTLALAQAQVGKAITVVATYSDIHGTGKRVNLCVESALPS